MSNYTKGKWYIDSDGQMIWSENPYGKGDMLIADIRGWGHLTGTGTCNFNHHTAVQIQDANMRLIATAPELLEALEACRKVIVSELINSSKHPSTKDAMKACFLAYEAITKAKGDV